MNYIHYTYKVTNLINGKYYFGKHSQEFGKIDNYFGSGIIISKALSKYGHSNFIKEVLEFFSTEDEAFEAEKKLLDEYVLLDEYCYNIYPGGKGAPIGEKHPMFNKLTVYDKNNKLIIISKEEYYSNKELYKTTQSGKLSVYDENNNKLFIDKKDYNQNIHTSIYKGIPLKDSAKEKLKNNSSLIAKVCVVDDEHCGFKLISKEEYASGIYKSHLYGKKHTQETKDKISISKKGTNHSDESKKKISNSLIGKFVGDKSPNYNKTGIEAPAYGYVMVRDENDNVFRTSTDNEDYINKKLKFAFSGKNSSLYNKIPVKIEGKCKFISVDEYANGSYDHVNKGNIRTKETKDKISKTLTGRKLSEDHKNKVCLNLDRRRKVIIDGIEFLSIKDAKHYCKNILLISYKEMKSRLKDDNFQNWYYKDLKR